MSFMEDYVRRCKEEVAHLKAQLKPLESGEMHIGERRAGSGWVDTTQKHIEMLKRGITTYEAILARHQL